MRSENYSYSLFLQRKTDGTSGKQLRDLPLACVIFIFCGEVFSISHLLLLSETFTWYINVSSIKVKPS